MPELPGTDLLRDGPRPLCAATTTPLFVAAPTPNHNNTVGDVHPLASAIDAAVATFRRPATVNWGDVARVMERAGADGFPIVVMITFLVGMVTAFHSAWIGASGPDQYIALPYPRSSSTAPRSVAAVERILQQNFTRFF